jgi:nickel/cobalt exporter
LQKTFYGLLLTIAFSVGLAITLTGVGLAFLYARQRFGSRLATGPWTYVLPLLSALLITVVGAVLCYGALASRTV